MKAEVFFVVTTRWVLVFYRQTTAKGQAMDLAHELAKQFSRPSRVQRVKSRPYFSAKQGRVVAN